MLDGPITVNVTLNDNRSEYLGKSARCTVGRLHATVCNKKIVASASPTVFVEVRLPRVKV